MDKSRKTMSKLLVQKGGGKEIEEGKSVGHTLSDGMDKT